MNEQTIGQIICEHRKEKRLTQKALADQLNITDKAVSKWERDIARPDISLVPQVAEILDIPVELLINIPLSAKEKTDDTPAPQETPLSPEQSAVPEIVDFPEIDTSCAMHREKAIHILKKGLLGFVIGFLIGWCTMHTKDATPFYYYIFFGMLFAGFPYGWELVASMIGNWLVFGSTGLHLVVFLVKFMGAYFVGLVATPLGFFYHLARSFRKGSPLRIICYVILAIFLAFFIWAVSICI